MRQIRILNTASYGLLTVAYLGGATPGEASVVPVVVPAVVLNGSFESGNLFPWSQQGNAAVVDASLGTPPSQGSYQALLQTEGGINRFTLERDFLGLPWGALNTLGNGTVFSGSAIRQGFQGIAGQVISFDWNFLTDELDERAVFNDFSFTFVGPILDDLVSKTSPGFLGTLVPGFDGETGYRSFSYVLPTDGFYALGIGVINVGDDRFNSALLIDNVALSNGGERSSEGDQAVPTPALLPGLLGFGLSMMRKRRRSPQEPNANH